MSESLKQLSETSVLSETIASNLNKLSSIDIQINSDGMGVMVNNMSALSEVSQAISQNLSGFYNSMTTVATINPDVFVNIGESIKIMDAR